MKDITVREISIDSKDYQNLLHFRNRLLRTPLGLDLFKEDLGDDADDHIIIAVDGHSIIGCVMLHPLDENIIKLRQMATDEPHQGKGLGRILMANAEETAVENGYREIVLHARITARGFYEKLGYTPYGDTFTEVTIQHIAMRKLIQ